jgi:hypothetical protein
VGGRSVYNFLNIHQSARISGLGGVANAIFDEDLSLISLNPAGLNQRMASKMMLNHQFYLSGIHQSYASMAFQGRSTGITFAPAISFIQYGEIQALDENGDHYGDFSANDMVIQTALAAGLYERIRGGINVKWIQSRLGSFNSNGIALDAGLLYLDTAAQVVIGLVFRNAGIQLKSYENVEKEPLPFEIQLGASKKLTYLPLRISAQYRYLNRWDIRFVNAEEAKLFLGQEPREKSSIEKFANNLVRHLGISGELLLGQRENVHLRLGYNHLMRKELDVNDFGSLAGFSFGFGIRAKKFNFDFGRTIYHLAGGVNHFGIGITPSDFFSNKHFD